MGQEWYREEDLPMWYLLDFLRGYCSYGWGYCAYGLLYLVSGEDSDGLVVGKNIDEEWGRVACQLFIVVGPCRESVQIEPAVCEQPPAIEIMRAVVFNER